MPEDQHPAFKSAIDLGRMCVNGNTVHKLCQNFRARFKSGEFRRMPSLSSPSAALGVVPAGVFAPCVRNNRGGAEPAADEAGGGIAFSVRAVKNCRTECLGKDPVAKQLRH